MHAFLTMSSSRINSPSYQPDDEFYHDAPSQSESQADGSEADDSEAGAAALHVTAADFDIALHDATLTLVSPRTGDHRTFKIETARHGNLAGKRIVSLLIGPDDYQGFGFVVDDHIVVWRRYRSDHGGPSMFERYGDMLTRISHWESRGVKYLISLNCRRCGRLLSRPDSLATGYGPICWEKVNG